MLLLVSANAKKQGFRLRRRADKGKIPPAIHGIRLGSYLAAGAVLAGRNLKNNLPALAPYVRRGDVLVSARSLAEALPWNPPLIEEFARRQCVNFCLRAIREAERRRRVQVMLIDGEGDCAGVAAELLSVCATVTVVTRHPERFAACAAYAEQQYGASPLITDRAAGQADLVVAPYGLSGFLPPAGALSAGPDCRVFPKAEELVVPTDVAAAVPAAFDPTAVAAGVFAAFHPPELMRATPAVLRVGGCAITPDRLIR